MGVGKCMGVLGSMGGVKSACVMQQLRHESFL